MPMGGGSPPQQPNISTAVTPPITIPQTPQLPNPAVGDAVQQQQQQAQGAQGIGSTVLTSPQGVTQAGPAAGPALAAVMPAGAAASLIGGPNLNQGQNQSLLG